MTQKRLGYDGNAFIGFIVFYYEWHLHIENKTFSIAVCLRRSIHQTELSPLFALLSISGVHFSTSLELKRSAIC